MAGIDKQALAKTGFIAIAPDDAVQRDDPSPTAAQSFVW
jgi:hypothetical protein